MSTTTKLRELEQYKDCEMLHRIVKQLRHDGRFASDVWRWDLRDFQNLKVWTKAHELVLGLYKVTGEFPQAEIYGITRQLRRAGVSIPANIADGCGRNTKIEFARFLHIAMGSASETQYHLLLARNLKFLKTSDYQRLEAQVVEVKRMLTSLIRKLTTSLPKSDS